MVGDSDGQLKKQTSMFLLLGKNDGDWCVCYAKVHSQLYATTNITAQLYATMCASASASASASAAASKILKKHPYFASNGAGLRRKSPGAYYDECKSGRRTLGPGASTRVIGPHYDWWQRPVLTM